MAKHGLAFEVAEKVWDDPNRLIAFDRYEVGEERWHAIGVVRGVVIVTVIHAYPDWNDEERIRIIGARRATLA
ncbi:MAG: BrnT family toxin, partial [Novosphingobium sp.]